MGTGSAPDLANRISALEEQLRRLAQERDAALQRLSPLDNGPAAGGKVGDPGKEGELLRIATSAARMGVYTRNLQTGENYWSPEFLAIYGLAPDQPLLLHDGIPASVHPEDRPRVLAEAMARMARISEPEFSSEHRIIRADGEIRWVMIRGRVEFDPHGRPLATFGLAMDLTERKRAEEALAAALQTAEKRAAEAEQARTTLEAILEHIPDGLAISDLGGRVTQCSRSGLEMSGLAREEMEGSTPAERCVRMALWEPDGLTPAAPESLPLAQALRTGAPVWNRELLIRRQDGKEIPIRSNAGVIRDRQGGITGAIHVWRDISDQKRIEEELVRAKAAAEEASRAKSEFLANMSHEIRTPMTVFMAAIEHLTEIDDDPHRSELLRMAAQAAGRLRALIEDILDFSRIEARKLELQEEPFELGACVQSAAGMFALPVREKGLQIHTEVSSGLPPMIVGDPDRLGQVLVNLIGNAVKFTHAGGIRICAEPRGEFVQFAVADSGIGIPEAKLELIFHSFSQADSSFARKFGGTGLGLAISSGLVGLMGGEISVRSREGEGSVFTFSIPLKPAAPQSGEPAAAPPADFPPVPAARILLAEDEPTIREMVGMMLARHGWQVEVAASGREALEKWTEGRFDLILMDLQMPEVDGLRATQAIRGRENGGRRSPIIGLTAHARSDIREQCLAAGMDDVLVKPVQMKDLFAAIESCLAA